jgi:hypothetical protein
MSNGDEQRLSGGADKTETVHVSDKQHTACSTQQSLISCSQVDISVCLQYKAHDPALNPAAVLQNPHLLAAILSLSHVSTRQPSSTCTAAADSSPSHSGITAAAGSGAAAAAAAGVLVASALRPSMVVLLLLMGMSALVGFHCASSTASSCSA